MLMTMLMDYYFGGMVDRQKTPNSISSRGNRQRSSQLESSDTPKAGLKPVENQNSGFAA